MNQDFNNENNIINKEEQLISTESTLCEHGNEELLCVQGPVHGLGTEKARVEVEHLQHTITSQNGINGQGLTYAQALLSKGVNSIGNKNVED